MEPERVPGSSYLAVLWMAGCGQRDMGDVESDMAVPKRDDGQTGASGKRSSPRAEGTGRGRGGVPLKTGVGVLQA